VAFSREALGPAGGSSLFTNMRIPPSNDKASPTKYRSRSAPNPSDPSERGSSRHTAFCTNICNC
jgi:hypothetical protein